MIGHSSYLSSWEEEGDHRELHSQFRASLGYLKEKERKFVLPYLQSLLMSWYGSCQFLTHVVFEGLRTLLFSGSLVHNLIN